MSRERTATIETAEGVLSIEEADQIVRKAVQKTKTDTARASRVVTLDDTQSGETYNLPHTD